MHHVVQLVFGSEAEEQIRSVWHSFTEQGISPQGLDSDGRPHVTVMSSALFAVASVREDLVSLANSVEPFEITFSHFGVFPRKEPVLFFGVTHTVTLMTLHQRFFDLISPVAEVFEFAKPDSVVFHCTLGFVLRSQDLPRAVELAYAAPLPTKAMVTGFEVVECGQTARRPVSFAFGARM